MHRDLKLGLALAVLLIGSTAAFFFRNDAGPGDGLPELRDPVRLDGEIADRDAAPYFDEAEAADESASIDMPWIKPAFLGGSEAVALHRAAVTPDPIQVVMEEDAEPAEPAGLPAAPSPEIDGDGGRVHVVQSGDTLSDLAATYLGSIARFGEIYELNRDILPGPHDLRIGMRLVIPAGESRVLAESTPTADADSRPAALETAPAVDEVSDAATAEAPVVEAARSAPADGEPNGGEADAQRLFEPARKTPFVPSRYRAPAVPSAKKVRPGGASRE